MVMNTSASSIRRLCVVSRRTWEPPGNPVKFNQSDDDFKCAEGVLEKCVLCIRCLANSPYRHDV